MSRGSNTGERSPEGPASPSPEPEYEALFGVESANDPEFEELMRRRALLLQELGECEDSDSEVLETPCKMQRLDDSYDAMEKIFEIEETNGAETSYFDDYKEETMTPRRSESQSSMEFEDEEEYEEFHEEVETNGKCPFSNGAKSPVIDTETLDEWLQQPLEENNGQSNGNLTVWKNVLDRMDNDCFYPMP
ncbi:unnamed protein product [Caenorhabditis auriculariae]|uniref:Uncharacterized protein n=1 Tax=Caenorhabditis auriculariae TaxID=2777116 RepID=A0A8S1H4P4_9PELO|nr:unnamed protein product [Caenorhabditis auriculariae]